MTATFKRAHETFEQRQQLVGRTKLSVLICDSITINVEQPYSPSTSKKNYSTKNHCHGLVSTGKYSTVLNYLNIIIILSIFGSQSGFCNIWINIIQCYIQIFVDYLILFNFFKIKTDILKGKYRTKHFPYYHSYLWGRRRTIVAQQSCIVKFPELYR